MMNLQEAKQGMLSGRKFNESEAEYLESVGCEMVEITEIGGNTEFLITMLPKGVD